MSWDASLIVAVIALFFVGVGLFINWFALRENNTTRQLQLFNDALENIRETEVNFYKDHAEEYEKDGVTPKKIATYELFNSIEKLAFFVNEKFIKKEKIASYFYDSIVVLYKGVYLRHSSPEEICDPKHFSEFKKLYQSIKSQQQK